MATRRRPAPTIRPQDLPDILQDLLRFDEDGPTMGLQLDTLARLREQGPEISLMVDQALIRELGKRHAGLAEARDAQQELRSMLEKVTEPPFDTGVFLGSAETRRGPAALVSQGNTHRVVPFSDDLDPALLEIGQEVLLTGNMSLVVQASPYPAWTAGETAAFDRYTSEGRLVLRFRDEEIVVSAATALADVELKPGDLVRWDRNLWLAFERLPPSQGEDLFLEKTPTETFEAIGGLDPEIAKLKDVIGLHYNHPELAAKYDLEPKGSVLLVGPPGNGKTMLARALANWMARLSPSGKSRFMNIRPGQLHSVWHSESERRYRETFRIAREAAEADPSTPVIMFFDEIDHLASRRGASINRVDDKIATAFFVELDGLERRGNVLVVGATNRADTLDAATLRFGRLTDLVINIPRPGPRAARAVFERHLAPKVPLDGSDAVADREAARASLLDSVVARIYAEDAESEVATLTLRDNQKRTVKRRDLISGATIRKICVDGKERACERDRSRGEAGLRADDLHRSADEEFARMARLLTPSNCRDHLEGLPQDMDVVSVVPVRRRVSSTLSYRRIA